MMVDQWQWEQLCGPNGLQPWNETSKDIGLCFQQLFLQIPLFFILAAISAYFVGYRKDWVLRERGQQLAIVFRSFVCLCLAFAPIIELYTLITSTQYIMYPIDYMCGGAACLSWLVHFGYILSLKHRLGQSARGPTGLLVLWTASALLSAIVLRSRILAGKPEGFNIATLVFHSLYLLSLLPSSHSRPTFYSPCLVGSQHHHSEYTPLLPHIDEGVLGTAMQGSGCYSQLIFSWVEPLFQKGLDNKLHDVEDVFELPAQTRCSYVGARLDRALVGNVDEHQKFEELPHQPFITTDYASTGETSVTTPLSSNRRVLVPPSRRHNVKLLRALHSYFGLQFYSIGLLKFAADALTFAGPMLLNKLVLFVEDESVDLHLGYLYAAGLFFSALLGALFNAHFNWLMSLIGLKMKGAMVSTILRKVLNVSPPELSKSFTVGEITNFMSTDTDRIVNSCPSFHALWSIPFQLFVTLFLMYQQVGISFLAGVTFAVILIPINKYVANKIGQLSTDMMRHKDSRVNLMSDMLQGIRAVKVHVWEDYFISKITESRDLELSKLRGRKYLDAVCVVLWATTPVLLAALVLTVYAVTGGDLRPHIVFTTVALVNMLIGPLNAFPWVLNGMTEAWVSVKRIQALLELKEMDSRCYYDSLDKNRYEDSIIIFKNASFSWSRFQPRQSIPKRDKGKGKSTKRLSKANTQRRDSGSSQDNQNSAPEMPFMLKELNLKIHRGELIGIGGPVGAGKTSLLQAIIAHMEKQGGQIQMSDSLDGFGYVSQKPWLVRGSIRDNILFGRPYDEARFKAVVDACALTEDMNVLGWSCSLGSSGCTLSGGQRSRIALARAVYQEKEVYLLDDVLSAVDAKVSQHILQRCIMGLLRNTTRVIVSHSSHVLARTDHVILLKDGRIFKQGPPETILDEIEEFLPSESEFVEKEEPRPDDKQVVVPDNKDTISRTSLDEEENVSDASVRWGVVLMYLRSVGWGVSLAILLSLTLMQLSQNFTFLWLSYWLNNRSSNVKSLSLPHEDEKNTLLDHGFISMDSAAHTIWNATKSVLRMLEGETNSNSYTTTKQQYYNPVELSETMSKVDMYYLEVYFGLAGLNLLFTILRAFLFAYGGIQAAAKMHKLLLKVVIMAKVKFFDVTPTGRILNRFSSDTYTVDDTLPFIINILLAQIFSLIGALAVTIYGLPWIFVAVLPLIPIYHWLQRRYRIVSRHLKRLQSVTLSPVYSHFSDTLDGGATICALNASSRWVSSGEELVESWQRAALCGAAASQWLSLRLQAMAVCVCGAAAVAAVMQRQLHVADAGLIGLAISYALSMTSTLGGVMSAFTETEREMIAVERVAEYINTVESERIDGDPLPYGWPSQGVITFENVVLKYSTRDNSKASLNDVSFSTHPGEKLGVVGRTGAGKSSLTAAILRLTSTCGGRVTIDGVAVDRAHLHALRSRIGVIPQEPFIFSGNVRENLDPLHQHTTAELCRALERCGARAVVDALGGLAADASSLSRGHRQLLCLARAVLQRPKILLIDEATANVDQETERTILEALRGAFAGSTVVMIAHRVLSVINCDRILVMDGGRVVECDQPDVLLDDPNTYLYMLLHAHA